MNKRRIGYAVLALAVLGGSSLGTLSNFLIPSPETEAVNTTSAPWQRHRHHLPIVTVRTDEIEEEEAAPPAEKPAPKVYLLNAWRFQINFLIFLVILPVLFLFERQRRKHDRMKSYLKILSSGRLKGKATFNFLNDQEIALLQHKMARGDEEDIKKLVEFAELHHQKTKQERRSQRSSD